MQNGERLRRERERNEYGCTFHVSGSYLNRAKDSKQILTTDCSVRSPRYYMMDRRVSNERRF